MSFIQYVELDNKDVKTTFTSKLGRELGTMGATRDGRRYAWSLAGEALSTAIPINPILRGGLAATALTNINTTIDTWEPSSTSRSIVLSTTWSTWGAIKDEYADGWMVVEKSTHAYAAGQRIRVKSNTAGSTSTTDSPLHTVITFADDDYLKAGVDAGATIQVVHNEYFDVIEHDGGGTTLPIIGVPNCEVADNEYFWAQTWGPCPVLNDGTLVYGNQVVGSTQTDQGVQALQLLASTGSSDTALASTLALISGVHRLGIGWCLGPSAGDNDYALIFLTIRP